MSTLFQRYLQATFRFLEQVPAAPPSQRPRPPSVSWVKPKPTAPPPPPAAVEEELPEEIPPPAIVQRPSLKGPALHLEKMARRLLNEIGLQNAGEKLHVLWNPRLKSTAGYASYPAWRIELNPLLVDHIGQVDRTLRHELAHLVAYHRAGRRRIAAHGQEWRQACADLGIPGEPVHHRLPLPRSRRARKLVYQCPHCRTLLHRVVAFKRPTACLSCCKAHNRGDYHDAFRFVRLDPRSLPPHLRQDA